MSNIYERMIAVAETRHIDANYASLFKSKRRSQVEAAAHELAHALVFGDEYATTSEIERAIGEMDDADADRQELRTLRIETFALRALGFRLDGIRLLREASFRLGNPRPAEMRKPLTTRESRLVRKFIRIINARAARTKEPT